MNGKNEVQAEVYHSDECKEALDQALARWFWDPVKKDSVHSKAIDEVRKYILDQLDDLDCYFETSLDESKDREIFNFACAFYDGYLRGNGVSENE